ATPFDRDALEILVVERDEVPLRHLVAFHQVVPLECLAVLLAAALEADRRHVGAMQQPEVPRMVASADVQLDRDIDEAEADRPFPQRTCHFFQRSSEELATSKKGSAAARHILCSSRDKELPMT